MAALIAKKKGNQLYYYVVESARVDGQPRIVHQGPGSFEVRELNKGKANITFDYRIVAKRRAYERVRLAEFKEAGERKQLAAGLTAKPAPLAPTAAASWASWAATPFPSSSQPGNNNPTMQPWKCSGIN
jgi:hypothetical protein